MPCRIRLKRSAAPALAFTILFSMALACNAQASERQVSIIGSSRIYNDVTNARNAAISEGLLSAVELVALDMIGPEPLKYEFDTVSRSLYENRQAIIQGYQVLKESESDDHYRLLIRVTVSEDKISDLLAAAGVSATPEELPRLLFLMTENAGGEDSYQTGTSTENEAFSRSTAAGAVRRIFHERGFSMVGAEELSRASLAPGADAGGGFTPAQAYTLSRRTGAEVVVLGGARASETPNKMGRNIRTFKGSISLSALDAATETRIATVNESAIAAGSSTRKASKEALTNAGTRAAQKLAERIISAWQQRLAEDRIEVLVKGGGDILKPLVQLREALRTISGVGALQTRQRSHSQALLSLRYDGSARDLADRLILSTFEGFGVDIYELSDERIHIELVTDQPITETDLDSS
jgi:hypothetical protein